MFNVCLMASFSLRLLFYCMRQVVTMNMQCLACDAVRSALAIFMVTVMSAPE
jgi:hypothetical protein